MLGCLRASQEAGDRALWLALRDPQTKIEAEIELVRSMRDRAHSLRRLPLALQFGLVLDLNSVEREIDRQEVLSDGMSPEVALARFSIALTKGPLEAVAYLDKHRQLLLRYLNPSFVASVEIQNLVDRV